MNRPAPDPITVDWLRELLERHQITQREAARLLHVDDVTVRRWCTGTRAIPWAAGELLRRLLTAPMGANLGAALPPEGNSRGKPRNPNKPENHKPRQKPTDPHQAKPA